MTDGSTFDAFLSEQFGPTGLRSFQKRVLT